MDTIRAARLALLLTLACIPCLQLGCSSDDPVRAIDRTPPGKAMLALSNVDSTWVGLAWTAPGDDGNEGTASVYELRYSTGQITPWNFEQADRWAGVPTPRSGGEGDGLTLRGLAPGTMYFFALRTADEAGNWSEISTVLSVKTRGPNPEDAHWWGGFGMQHGLFGDVLALTTFDGQVVAGGGFPGLAARWDGEAWTTVGDGFHGLWVEAFATYRDDLIAAGTFLAGSNSEVRSIAAWDGSTWSPLGSGLTDPHGGAEILALAVFGDRLVAGGKFSEMGGVPASNVAMWDGSSWNPLSAGLNGAVRALAVHNGALFAGGDFTSSGTTALSHVAAWNGASWTALGSGFAGPVTALTTYGDRLHAAARAAGAEIAAWDGNGWQALDGCEVFRCVITMAEHEHRLYIGGQFGGSPSLGCDSPFHMVAVWDDVMWRPLGSGLASPTEDAGAAALLSHGGALYVGGVFFTAGTDSSLCIARWED